MKKTTMAALGLTMGLLAAQGYAADSTTPVPNNGKDAIHEHHNKADTNGDGFVSKDEFMAKAQERFTKMDTNHDGKISPEEHKAAREEFHEKMQEHRAEWQAKHPDAKAPGNTVKQ